MQILNPLSLTSNVNDWLANSRDPRILHIFDGVCNLINERREVLSIVTPRIGNGPFNLVVDDTVCFSELLSLESSLFVLNRKLVLGDLIIQVASANLWSPQPDWKRLHDNRNHVLNPSVKLQMTCYQFSSSLASSLALADLPSSVTVAKQLAGLGAGLTPSGDDFIMGALYAAWMIHPWEVASELAQAIADTAAPLTTSLSAAWLRAAGRGEAGILWHEFFDALLLSGNLRIQQAINKILAVGQTSGADALAGFYSTLNYASPQFTL